MKPQRVKFTGEAFFSRLSPEVGFVTGCLPVVRRVSFVRGQALSNLPGLSHNSRSRNEKIEWVLFQTVTFHQEKDSERWSPPTTAIAGALPRELGTLRALRVLYLGGNLITGAGISKQS